MRHQHISMSKALGRATISVVVFVAASGFAIQDSPAAQAVTPRHSHAAMKSQEGHSSNKPDQNEYGPLITELVNLATKLQQGVQVPAPRTHSKLLQFLPASSTVYVSAPNYGEVLYQANQIFNQELQQSKVLSDWWRNKVGPAGMMVEAVIDQVHQFMAYLGEEIVISGNVKEKGGSMLIAAEVRKPGLKAYLQQLLDQYGGPNAPLQILTPQQLATAKAPPKDKPFIVLVRSDFLAVASDIGVLRSFNVQLDRGTGTFATTPFGQRLDQEYQGGVGFLAGADLQPLLALRPQSSQQSEAIFQQSGFADLKYAILDGKYSGGIASSNIELSFNGPRKGFASWLGTPADLGSLDFVSPKATYAIALVLKKPAQLFDDIKALAETSNPTASSGLSQMETELKIDFKQDLLSKLSGQLAVALESPMGPTPDWKAILQVSDPDGLQKTIKQLLASMNAKGGEAKGVTLVQKTKEGLSYTSVTIASGPKNQEIAYTFVDGYLVAASSPGLLKEAVDMHRSGTSLARSSEFRKLLPAERSGQASAVVFQNSALTMASFMGELPPDLSGALQSLVGKNAYSVMTAFGEDSAIRISTSSHALDMGVPLMVAAIAIPNLMRSKTSANQSSATATVRTLNTAQATYQITYASYAPDLASMGPGADGNCDANGPTAKHACLLDSTLGCASGTWCTKNGFQFNITATCDKNNCQDYVVVGTPVDSSAGKKSYCSTSDAVVRSKSGPPLTQPISADECRTWEPL